MSRGEFAWAWYLRVQAMPAGRKRDAMRRVVCGLSYGASFHTVRIMYQIAMKWD